MEGMKRHKKLITAIVTVLVFFQLVSAQQNIIEVVGFGQATDAAKENERQSLKIRLAPGPITTDISGRIVPLSIPQYMNYTFTSYTPRTMSQEVLLAITDEAEHDDERQDFNNASIDFTLSAGERNFDIEISDIIYGDDVNEAAEQLILVLEITNATEIELDEHGGVLVLTILDDNPIFLFYNISSYIFCESDGTVQNVIKVQKHTNPPPTEVVISIKVVTRNGTATAGIDFWVTNAVQEHTIGISELEVELDPITIVDDNFPEANETFFLYLMKGDEGEFQNIFPTTVPAMMTIIDKNVAEIGFVETEYLISESESLLEVCIAITNGQSLDNGYGSATINIVTDSTTATGDSDYVSTPVPSVFTIQRGQERMCSNITIYDDSFIETNETFTLSLVTESTNFSAGVTLTPGNATVVILDNDGVVAGFAMGNYSGVEGESISVCVTVHFPNETILSMSNFEGQFRVTGSGMDIFVPEIAKVLNTNLSTVCFVVDLISDDLIEETEVVMLSLELMNDHGINEVAPSTTTIFIEDEDFAVIGFNQSTYVLHEQSNQDSFVDVCVDLISGTIAMGVSINYRLEYDATGITHDSTIDSTIGSFTAGVMSVCHHITVFGNNVVEPHGIIVVKILNTSLEPSNTALINFRTDVTVVNDDIVTVSVDVVDNTILEGHSTFLTVTYTGILHPQSAVTVIITSTPGSASVIDDYVVGIPSPHSVNLTNFAPQSSFFVYSINDAILEDYEEDFKISISLDNTNILADILTSEIEIKILDNEVLQFTFNKPSFVISESIQETQFILVTIENFDTVIIPQDISIAISAVVDDATSNATQGLDYTIGIQDLVFRHDTPSSGLNISFDILTDTHVEGQEVMNFILNLSSFMIDNLNNTNAAVLGTHGSSVVVITDDDRLNVGFANESIIAAEGDSILVCAEVLNGTLGAGLLLDYFINAPRENPDLPVGIEADSATHTSTPFSNDGDYTVTSKRVSLSATTTTQCVEIQLIEDTIVEMDEFFLVQLEQILSSEDLIFKPDPEYIEVTIVDNDEIRMGFSSSQYQFSEGAGSLPESVYIVRENAVTVSSTFTVTVVLQTTSTASDTSDFSVPGGFNVSITFGGDEDRLPFPLEIVNDAVGEGDETIELLLTTFATIPGIVPGSNDTTRILIIEDDFITYQYTQQEYHFTEKAPTTQVCLEIVSGVFPAGGYLTVALFTSQLTATVGVDYALIPAPSTVSLTDTTRTVCTNLFIAEDVLVEGQETFEVYFEVDSFFGSFVMNGDNSTVITILDSNVAEIGFRSSMYTVVEGKEPIVTMCVEMFSGELTDIVSLSYSVSLQSVSATEYIDYGSIIFPDTAILNRTSNTSCHFVVIYDDEDIEPPEMFSVSITTNGPSEFISLFDIIIPETIVWIIDNDSLSIGFENMAYTVSENSGTVEVCLMFEGPLKNSSFVELQISLTSVSATDADFSAIQIPSTLSLNVTNSRGCVSISITNDNIVEGTEMFLVHFVETDNNQIAIAGSNTTSVFIQDDEIVVLQFGQMIYMFSESNSSNALVYIEIANFDQLDIQNNVSVVVNINTTGTNANEDDYEIAQASNEVLISSGMRSAPFALSIFDDVIVEGMEQVTLVMSQGYIVGIEPNDAVISDGMDTIIFIVDNDAVTIGFTATSYTSFEAEAQVCVVLHNGILQTDTIVNYRIRTLNTAEPFMVEGVIEAAATFHCHNITVVDDDVVEGSEDVQVSLIDVDNEATVLLRPNRTTITVEDDDTLHIGFKMAEYFVEEGEIITIRIIQENDLEFAQDFNVILRLNSGSNASEGEDYTISGGTIQILTFGDLEIQKEINVTSLHDDIGEGDEVIILDLINDETNFIDVNIGQSTTQITILEDDVIPVSLNVTHYYINEGATLTDLCVRVLDPERIPSDGFVSFSLSTTPRTATADDYIEPAPNHGTLNRAVPVICSVVNTVSDAIVEGSETFTIRFVFEEASGSFIVVVDSAEITILDDDYFQLGFEHSTYEIQEEDGLVTDVVYIVKMNENILQKDYYLTIDVIHDFGIYTAVLNEDFEVDDPPPLTVTFESNLVRLPIPIYIIDDELEEGYENFSLEISYNELEEPVQITTASTNVFIKDDDVVVIGFERSFYVVYEGLEIEVCVAVQDRELSNDEDRQFIVATSQLTTKYVATRDEDYKHVQEITSISQSSVSRQCFTFVTIDDEMEEEPERLKIAGTAISHFIEFNPDHATIWIVDDESLLLPVPDITTFNCTSVIEETSLKVTCIPPPELQFVELLCAIDHGTLWPCPEDRGRNVTSLIVTVNLNDYSEGQHTLEIVGLTQVPEILRTTVTFYAKSFELTCTSHPSEPGLIEVTCNSTRVVESLTCSIDDKVPEVCTLHFVLKPEDYGEGIHTLVVTATNLQGEKDNETLTFESSQTATLFTLNEGEFAATLTIIVILVIVLTVICLLIICQKMKAGKVYISSAESPTKVIQNNNANPSSHSTTGGTTSSPAEAASSNENQGPVITPQDDDRVQQDTEPVTTN